MHIWEFLKMSLNYEKMCALVILGVRVDVWTQQILLSKLISGTRISLHKLFQAQGTILKLSV